MPASAPSCALCHEARAQIVALISCCLVRLSDGGSGLPDSSPARARSEVLAVVPLLGARLDLLVPSGGVRGRCKALFFSLCTTEHPSQIQTSAILRTLARLVTALHPVL